MLLVVWVAECNLGDWNVGMRCSPGVVTATSVGAWIDFDLSHKYDKLLQNQKKQVMGERGND